jgi:hypothetical protein
LTRAYFEEYEVEQLALEYELEEMGAVALKRCTPECRARQVHVSREAQEVGATTGKQEWSYVNARCGECGRVAGRSAALVNIERT